MKYIAYQRFKGKSLSGSMNIPAASECECDGNLITYNGKPVCYATSYNGQQYFANNDDGNGMERGRLTRSILAKLAEHDDDEAEYDEDSTEERPLTEHQKRWNAVWGDFACRLHKQPGDENEWHWAHSFYSANIESLRHIANLVGVKR